MRFRLVGDLLEAFVIEIEADSEEEAIEQLRAMHPRAIQQGSESTHLDLSEDSVTVADTLED